MTSVTKSSKTLFNKLRDLSKLSKPLNKLQLQPMKILKGTFMKSSNEKGEKSNDDALRRFLIKRMGHLRYGLYSEDLINEDFPIVVEAIKRLPPEVYDARVFRIVRAIHLDAFGKILPKEEWISYEEDRDYRYLTPYIIELEYEIQEKRDYGLFI